MKKKIISAVINDISTDERVNKICNSLQKKGHQLTAYGRILKDTKEVERAYKIIRKKHFFNNNFIFYAEFNIRLFFYLINNKYDYIIANDLDTLPACYLAGKITKSKVVYDSHEYFTEVPVLQGRTFVRNFWMVIEKIFLPRIKKSFTVGESIAKIYSEKYHLNMGVIKNLPSLHRKIIYKDVKLPTQKQFILYQGTLTPGRGLKPMIKALHFLKIDMLIIGFGKEKEDLETFVKKEKLDKRVFFLGKIPHEELPNYTKKATLGMVLEEPMGKSFELSLPNKLFDLIHAQTPIVASNLPEIKKIISQFDVGEICEDHNPETIARVIKKILESPERYQQIKENQLKAKNVLNWEHQETVLYSYFKDS